MILFYENIDLCEGTLTKYTCIIRYNHESNQTENYYILMQPISDEFDHIRGVLDVFHSNAFIDVYRNEKLENNIAYKMIKTDLHYIYYLVLFILNIFELLTIISYQKIFHKKFKGSFTRS